MRNWLLISAMVFALPVSSGVAQDAVDEPVPPIEAAPAEQPTGAPQLTQMTISDLLNLAREYFGGGDFSQAMTVLSEIVRRDPTELDALRLTAEVAYERKSAGDMDIARRYWLEVRKLQPTDFEANFGLGRLYLANSAMRRNAIEYLRVAETVAPPDRKSEVLTALAQAYLQTGRRDDALQTAQEATALDTESFAAWRVLTAIRGETAVTEADFDEALLGVERLKQLARRELDESGTSREVVEKLYGALELERVILQRAGSVIFARNPDGTLSERVLPGQEARAAATLARVADVMLRQAELQKVLLYFQIVIFAEKAVMYDNGTNPGTLRMLADLKVQTGERDEALELYRRILELSPDDPYAQEAIRTLEGGANAPANPEPASPEAP